METLHDDGARRGAAFLARRSGVNPREILIALIEEADDVKDKDGLFENFRSVIQNDDRYQRAIDWYFFINMYDYLVTSRNRKSFPSPQQKVDRARAVENIKMQVERVVLLNLVLPNGKMLRDSTFADCSKVGGWLTKVAAKGKPSQIVGRVLNEHDLVAIMKATAK